MIGFPDVWRSGVCAVHWRWPKWRGRASSCELSPLESFRQKTPCIVAMCTLQTVVIIRIFWKEAGILHTCRSNEDGLWYGVYATFIQCYRGFICICLWYLRCIMMNFWTWLFGLLFFSKFDFSNSWHLGYVWYDIPSGSETSFRTWPKDVLKKIHQDDGVGDLGQDMFEAVNLIDPTDEEVAPTAVKR